MTSDVFRSGPVDRRSYLRFGLGMFALVGALALLLALDPQSGYPLRVFLPFLLGTGVLGLGVWGWVVPWLISSWVVEIGPDVIRWRGGFYRRDRVIRRALVVEARRNSSRYHVRLDLYDANGKRVGMVPLSHFRAGRVVAALHHHGWPAPEVEDLLPSWGGSARLRACLARARRRDASGAYSSSAEGHGSEQWVPAAQLRP